MDFYHGSTVADLKELKPFASEDTNLKEPVVYLTTSKQLALHYIWNLDKVPAKMPMLKMIAALTYLLPSTSQVKAMDIKPSKITRRRI